MEDKDINSGPTNFGAHEPDIAKSSGTGEVPHKQGGDPTLTLKDLNKARKVWGADGTSDLSGRVADAGDGGGTHSMPYDIETFSDAVNRQTKPRDA